MAATQEKPPLGRVSLTERIDRVATHPISGLFILLLVLCLIFGLVYSIGLPLQKLLEVHLIESGHTFVTAHLNAPTWVRGLLANGIISGVGTVLTFIPILMLFFAAWAFMEDVGYTARAAFVTDKFMHSLGLHGKSVLPLVLGFGCNVPAILGTRIIDSPRSRLLTILVTPLVPCTARMAVITLIAAAFFGNAAIFVSIGIIIFSLIMLIITGLIMNRFVVGGEDSALLMELPLYHLPNPKIIGLVTWQNTVAFIKRAGTIILSVSVVIWILSYIPNGDINTSLLSNIGKFLEPSGKTDGIELANDGGSFIQFHRQGEYYCHSGNAYRRTRGRLNRTIEDFTNTSRSISFFGSTGAFYPLCCHRRGNPLMKPSPGAGRFLQ